MDHRIVVNYSGASDADWEEWCNDQAWHPSPAIGSSGAQDGIEVLHVVAGSRDVAIKIVSNMLKPGMIIEA